jgi:hypothetical protein
VKVFWVKAIVGGGGGLVFWFGTLLLLGVG